MKSSLLDLSIILIAFSCVSRAQRDLTRQDGASGGQVVEATVHLIRESCYFPHDHLYLRRLAYVISQDGLDPSTYRPGYNGGIWNVSEAQFKQTLVQANDTASLAAFGIAWSQVTWADLRKPLYSAIAAGLVALETNSTSAQFPVSVYQQAALYHVTYSRDQSEYISQISQIDSDCVSQLLDLVFVLDESGSIGYENFQISKQFTYEVINSFNIAPDAVRVALITYDSNPTLHFNLDKFTSTQAAVDYTKNIGYGGGGTATNLGLDLAADLFEKSSRDAASKVAVVATDGQSGIQSTNASAEALKAKDVTVFAIGIGTGINEIELNAIASKPKCVHLRKPKSFEELLPMISDIKQASCKATAVQKEGSNNTYSCLTDTSFKLDVKDGHSVMVRPDSGSVKIFGSFTTSLPNQALSDFETLAHLSRPLILLVKNTTGTIALTVTSSNETGECKSTYELVVYPQNVLNFQADNLCVHNKSAAGCTIIDIFAGHENIGLLTHVAGQLISEPGGSSLFNQSLFNQTISGNDTTDGVDLTNNVTPRPCPSNTSGIYGNPGSETNFIVCLENGQVHVVPCPEGLGFDPDTKSCTKQVITPDDLLGIDANNRHCKFCSQMNWQLGMRNFAIPGNVTAYIACTYIEMCEFRLCENDTFYDKDQQACLAPVIPAVHKLQHSAKYPCTHSQSVELSQVYKSTVIVRPESGQVHIFGSFSNKQPDVNNFDFQSSANETTPAIFYLKDATGAMYVTIDAGAGTCSGFVNVTRVSGNALRKFGFINQCFYQHIEVKCKGVDYLEHYNYTAHRTKFGQIEGLHLNNPCTNLPETFHRYPFSGAHFLYCDDLPGRVLEVDCPHGTLYSTVAEDCVLDTKVDLLHPCRVCHQDNWHLHKRSFGIPGDRSKYINCTHIDQCVVADCRDTSVWSDDTQSCIFTGQHHTVTTSGPNIHPSAWGLPTSPAPPAFTDPTGSSYLTSVTTGHIVPVDTDRIPIPFNCPHQGVEEFYAQTHHPNKYVRCDTDGIAYIEKCPEPAIWNQQTLGCQTDISHIG